MSDGVHPLPSGWVYAALGESCLIIQGQSPPGETYNTAGEGLPFFQGKAEFGEIYPTTVKWCSAPTKTAEPGDVLISIRAPVGPTNLCPALSCIGRGLAAVRPFGGTPPRYVLYGLRSTENVLASKGTGTTFTAVGGGELRAHGLPLAPLAEQRRIVEEIEKQLTRLDAAVAALERARANLKRYRASVLRAACEGRLVPTEAELARAEGRDYETADKLLERILKERRGRWEADQLAKMQAKGKVPEDDKWKAKYQEPSAPETDGLPEPPEGWAWATSDTLFSFVTSGSRGWAEYYSTEGPLFLRMGNLDHDSISLDLADVQRVNAPSRAEGRRTRVRPGDILISITADVGMIALIPVHLDEAYINQHIALARPVDSAQAPYVAWFLASERGQQQLRKLQRGATKVGLGLNDIRAVLIPVPPASEQQRIVAELERRLSVIAELEIANSHGLRRAERLRQSLLKRAFEGKLVPQDPNDEPASVLLERIRKERSSAAQAQDSRRKGRGQRRRSVRQGAVASQSPFERKAGGPV